MSRRTTGQRSEAGFMLLFVFLLAAVAALSLYIELPRIAFESQRMREELLVERGEQYKRAIQLFVRKKGRYPARMEDLESTDGIRFLRRRYLDPMTGKDEWRLIRVGPTGEFLDSVTMKKKDDKKKSENTFITEFAGIGQTSTTTGGANTIANRVRPSEQQGAPGSQPGGPEGQGGQAPIDPNNPNYPGGPPPPPGPEGQQPPNILGQLGVIPQQTQPGQTGQPGQPPVGYPQQGMPPGMAQQLGLPVVGQPGQPGQQVPPGFNPVGRYVPGAGTTERVQQAPWAQGTQIPSSSQTGGVVPQQQGFGGGGFGQAPGNIAQNPQALAAINQALTQPRPNGAFPQQPGMGAGMMVGPGIAGVASKYEAEGIKVINEKTKYNEWEFIYDLRKEMQQQAQGNMPPGAQGNPNPLGGSANPGFGNSTGLGGSQTTGFGNQGTGFGNPGTGFGNQGLGQQSPTGTRR